MKNKQLIVLLGFIGFFIYLFMLWFRPQISWCDDTFFVDWSREMAINGQFESHPWPNSTPDYVPLYPLLLAGWIKILGFSYFKVHLLEIFLALINHCLVLNLLVNRNVINKATSIIGISICIWFGHTMFWINNSGRPEVLTLTMTIIALYYLFKLYFNKSNTNIIKFFLSSSLVLLSGVQGFVALLFITVVLLLHNFKKSISGKKHIIVAMFFGGLLSLSLTCFFFYLNGALRSFFVKTILYSNTASYVLYLYRSKILNQDVEPPTGSDHNYYDRIEEIIQNPEYCFFAIFLILIFLLFRKKISDHKWTLFEKTTILSSIVLPLFFELAGRYPIYYTYFAYYLIVISLFIVLERLISNGLYSKIIVSIIGVLIFVNFVFSPPFKKVADVRIVDIDHNTDRRVLNDIKKSGISFDQPVVIPNEWYYMLIEKYSENLFYQSSGYYPSNLKWVVEIPTSEYINNKLEKVTERKLVKKDKYLYVYKVNRLLE